MPKKEIIQNVVLPIVLGAVLLSISFGFITTATGYYEDVPPGTNVTGPPLLDFWIPTFPIALIGSFMIWFVWWIYDSTRGPVSVSSYYCKERRRDKK